MRTSITTFQERVQGNLHFPILTEYGVIEDNSLGTFYNLLTDSGYHLTVAERNALVEFLAAGEVQGWRDKLLYVMPLIGDVSSPSAVACPLIARIGTQDKATIGVSGSYDGSNDYESMLSLNGNKVVGIKGGDKVLSLHVTALDLFTKVETALLANKTQFGIVLYGDFEKETGVVNDVFGVQPSGLVEEGVNSNTVAGITLSNNFRVAAFGAETAYVYPAQNDNHFVATGFQGTLRNLIRVYYGDLNAIEFRQDDAQDYPDHVNVPVASISRVTVGGVHTNQSLSLSSNRTLRHDLRFFAITDGTMSETLVRGFAVELQKLMSVFGKLY